MRSTTPERLRLFFALWPDAELRRRLWELAQQAAGRHGRAVAADNLHLTLAFLGSLDTDHLDAVRDAAAAVDPRLLSITFDRLEHWQRPRLVCLVPSRPPAVLSELVTALAAALRSRELPTDDRPFTPHVTLARRVRAPDALPPFQAPIRWTATGFQLVASRTEETGPVYSVIGTWPAALGGTA